MKYTHRFLARVILEAKTPLFVGSGNQDLLKDALVQKDHHGLPMIPGTSLIGVLRHSLEDHASEEDQILWNNILGYQINDKGKGSQIRISSAYLVLPNGKIAEGLTPPPDAFTQPFEQLPIRQHVRINHKGTAQEQGLFDNEVVYKGCRFKFEMELKGDGSETKHWERLLSQLKHPLFRIGQGTRNGYGRLGVESCEYRIYNLGKKEDFDDYLAFNPSLNSQSKRFQTFDLPDSAILQRYQLQLQPDDSFFIFGSGYANEKVDQHSVKEEVLEYQNGQFHRSEQTLIPASSIKGAIRHRTCFHYNRLSNIFADKIEEDTLEQHIGKQNKAVRQLFGYEVKGADGQRGRVITNDTYYTIKDTKIFNHVAIDRFTGGAIDGALFSEEVNQHPQIVIDLWLEDFTIDEDKDGEKKKTIIEAFECALQDICKGYLPLGGMTTKGHGIFKGQFITPKSTPNEYLQTQ